VFGPNVPGRQVGCFTRAKPDIELLLQFPIAKLEFGDSNALEFFVTVFGQVHGPSEDLEAGDDFCLRLPASFSDGDESFVDRHRTLLLIDSEGL